MAITILQQPTSPNMANADLLFEVSSNQISQAQFQYVCDIFESGSATLIQRIKQQPNPTGYGVFNLRQILSYQLESDKVWKASPFNTAQYSNKDFVVKFGEEYGTSVSSSVLIYNGITNATSSLPPAKTGSAFYTITDGLVDPNSGGWNFPSSSYYTASLTPTGGAGNFSKQHALTNSPTTLKIQDGEYGTISLYNGNFDGSNTNAQDIYQVQIRVYNSAGSNIQNISYTNLESEGGGPRTNGTQEWQDVGIYDTQTNKTRLLTIGLGPQNFDDAGDTLNANWAYYLVDVLGQESAGIEDGSAVYASFRYEKQNPECIDNGVRFAWKNEFGVWDYYTFTLATSQTSTMERLEYEQTFVPYNTSGTTANYDITRRGIKPFNTKITQDKTANSDWLTQTEADWIRELFYSTNVYVQSGTDFLPVVITSANLTEKTNPRTQKVFQYQINYKLANQPRSRF